MRAAKTILFLWALLFAAPAIAADNLTIANCYVNNSANPYTWNVGQAALVQCDTQGRLVLAPSSVGSSTANQGTPNTAANAWPFYIVQGGAALSSTNPIFEQTVGPSMQAPGTAPTTVRGIQGATAGIPVNTNTQQLAGTTLGAPTAYGTAPTGNVPGVNANVTASALPAGAATSAGQANANFFRDQAFASLSANGTYTGVIRSAGTAFDRFSAVVVATVAGGTVNIIGCDVSDCSAATYVLATASVGASATTILTAILPTPFARVTFVNGSTAQTNISITSSLTAN